MKYGTLRLYSNAAPKEVLELETKYDYISGHVCISCGRLNVPMLIGGWVEPLCENCYNKRIAKNKSWHEKNCKDRNFVYTPYKDLKKEKQEINLVVTYKCFSPEYENHEKKCDYSNTINKILERQAKLFKQE